MTLEEQQLAIERDAVVRGAEAYRASVRAAQEGARELDTPPGVRFTNRMMRKLVPAIQKFQRKLKADLNEKGARARPYAFPLLALPASALAIITLRTVMSAHKREHLRMARNVARNVKLEIDWQDLRRREREKRKKDPEHFDLARWWAKKLKRPRPHIARRWMKNINALSEPWGLPESAAVGGQLIALLVEACPGEFEITERKDTGRHRMRTIREVVMTDRAREQLDKVHDVVAFLHPWRCPCVCKPKPWRVVK